MRKQTIDSTRRCPKCGSVENQIKKGRNVSGTQRCLCKACNITYTIDAKTKGYPEELRQLAIKRYRQILGYETAEELGVSKSTVYNWLKQKRQGY